MRLSTMWMVDQTLDDEDRSPVADAILGRWEHDAGSARPFRSSANFVYRFRRGGAPRFLRFAAASERSRREIEAEVRLLAWLVDAGVPVAAPEPSARGALVETVGTAWGPFHAVVFPAVEGEQFEVAELDEARFRRWGAALGDLHAALRRYPYAAATPRESWRERLAFVRAQAPEDDVAVQAELDEVAASLAALPESRETYGLIHGDFELDNLVWRGDAVSILDFDDCSFGWYAADVAYALGDYFGEGGTVGDDRFRAFVAGYAERCAPDPDLLARVPLFVRLADLTDYARIMRSLDLPPGEYPEWLVGLEGKLRDRVRSYRTALEENALRSP